MQRRIRVCEKTDRFLFIFRGMKALDSLSQVLGKGQGNNKIINIIN